MHWRTFWRLFDEHEEIAEAAIAGAKPLKKADENNDLMDWIPQSE